jgi:hypothetical protein
MSTDLLEAHALYTTTGQAAALSRKENLPSPAQFFFIFATWRLYVIKYLLFFFPVLNTHLMVWH